MHVDFFPVVDVVLISATNNGNQKIEHYKGKEETLEYIDDVEMVGVLVLPFPVAVAHIVNRVHFFQYFSKGPFILHIFYALGSVNFKARDNHHRRYKDG